MASSAPKIKLVYFSAFAGRSGAIQDALKIGKIAYEYEGLDFPTFGQQKAAGRFPLGSVPVMSIDDGPLIPQSNALLRYAGKLANLYPTDAVAALVVDAILDTTEEMFKGLGGGKQGEELKQAREKITAEDIPKCLAAIERLSFQQTDKYLVGDALTIADLKLWSQVSIILSGFLDHITLDLSKYPKLHAWYPFITEQRTSLGL